MYFKTIDENQQKPKRVANEFYSTCTHLPNIFITGITPTTIHNIYKQPVCLLFEITYHKRTKTYI